jgi:hypothetical protein
MRNQEKIETRDKLRLLEIDVTSCLRNEEVSVSWRLQIVSVGFCDGSRIPDP